MTRGRYRESTPDVETAQKPACFHPWVPDKVPGTRHMRPPFFLTKHVVIRKDYSHLTAGETETRKKSQASRPPRASHCPVHPAGQQARGSTLRALPPPPGWWSSSFPLPGTGLLGDPGDGNKGGPALFLLGRPGLTSSQSTAAFCNCPLCKENRHLKKTKSRSEYAMMRKNRIIKR